MDLHTTEVFERGRGIKMTVLCRRGGVWHPTEVGRLACRCATEVSEHPEHPEYLVLFGHHTREQTLAAIEGTQPYTATMVVGVDDTALPYVPGFAQP